MLLLRLNLASILVTTEGGRLSEGFGRLSGELLYNLVCKSVPLRNHLLVGLVENILGRCFDLCTVPYTAPGRCSRLDPVKAGPGLRGGGGPAAWERFPGRSGKLVLLQRDQPGGPGLVKVPALDSHPGQPVPRSVLPGHEIQVTAGLSIHIVGADGLLTNVSKVDLT